MSDSLINTLARMSGCLGLSMPFGGNATTIQLSKAEVSNINRSPNEPIFPNSPVNDPSPRSLAYSHRRGLRSSSGPSPCNDTLPHPRNSVTPSSNTLNLGNALLSVLSHLRRQPDILRGADLFGGARSCSLFFKYVSFVFGDWEGGDTRREDEEKERNDGELR